MAPRLRSPALPQLSPLAFMVLFTACGSRSEPPAHPTLPEPRLTSPAEPPPAAKPINHVAEAAAARLSGDIALALHHLSDALADDPKNFEALTLRADLYQMRREYDKALADLDRAVALQPQNAGVYVQRGTLQGIRGRPRRAIEDFNKALELSPGLTSALDNRGFAHEALGENEKALADYNAALDLVRKRGLGGLEQSPVLHRAALFIKLGKFNEAHADLNELIERAPSLADAWCNRGVARHHLGQLEEALADFSQAIKLDPKHVAAYYNRAVTYQKQGDSLRAERDIATARELNNRAK